MKRILLVVLWAFLLWVFPLSATSWLQDFFYPVLHTDSWTRLMFDRKLWVYHVYPTSRSFTFLRRWYTHQELKQTYWVDKVFINAWYFWWNQQWFFPAWHLAFDSSLVDPVHCLNDSNLCGMVSIDDLLISEHAQFTSSPSFSAWPVLMLNGVVNRSVINAQSHRQRATRRTVLVSTPEWPVFILSQKPRSLPWMLAYIVKHYGRSLSVINLDGWSSTTLLSNDPLFMISSQRRLPGFFILD